jgi:hypothetical protein
MNYAQDSKNKTEKLAVLWVSGDRDVAEKSCLMYTHAAKLNGWFDEVVLIVWGSSSRLLADPAYRVPEGGIPRADLLMFLPFCLDCADGLIFGLCHQISTE